MSENTYRLSAWTENGEIMFSDFTLREQEMLLQEEIYCLDCSKEQEWEFYSRLSHLYLQWGMLLLEMNEYWEAYRRFVDGLYVCRDAIRFLRFPKDGGVNPFLLAMDDLYEGCKEAAWREKGTLEEVLYEDGIHDIRRQLWESAPTP